MTVLSADQIGSVNFNAGFRGENLVISIAICLAESGGNDAETSPPNHTGDAADGSVDRGLWQINSHWHSEVSDEDAYYAPAAARAAYVISDSGNNFRPWATFNPGDGSTPKYIDHMDVARSGARIAEGGSAAGLPPSSLPGAPLTPEQQALKNLYANDVPPPLPAVADDFTHPNLAPREVGALLLPDGTDLSQAITGGTVDLSVSEVSELRFVITDPGLVLYKKLQFKVFSPQVKSVVAWYGDLYAISAVEIGQGPATEQVTIVCRSYAAEVFRSERTREDTGATTVKVALDKIATTAPDHTTRDFTYQIDPGIPDEAFVRQIGNSINPASVETDWAAFQRVGLMVRSWFFEDKGVFYLGRPSWLIAANDPTGYKTKQFKVGWLDGWGGDETFRAIECPDVRQESDVFPPVKFLRCKLPRSRGEQIRPGMRLNLQGIGAEFDIAYIVTRVSYKLDGGVEPAEITAQEPVDPFPTDLTQYGIAPFATDQVKPQDTPQNNHNGGAVGPTAGQAGMQWPCAGPVTQEFGAGIPPHSGIDIGVPDGTPIYAADDGTVTAVSTNGGQNPPFVGYGNAIIISHGSGTQTLYAHLQPGGVSVAANDEVKKGHLIGYSGHTGNVTGPHLHFEVIVQGTRVNPRSIIIGEPADPSSKIPVRGPQ